MTATGSRSDLDLMRAHADAVFSHTVHERMCVTDAQGVPNPIVFYGRTAAGSLVRFREDVDETLKRRLMRVMPADPVAAPISPLPPSSVAIAQIISEVMPESTTWSGPAYVLVKLPSAPLAVRVVRATVECLSEGFALLIPRLDDIQPIFCVVERGRAVSVCFSARTTSDAAEAGLQTLEQFRGRGYAAAVARSWAWEIQHSGRLALYSTAWANAQSMAVAEKLGAYCLGVDFHVSAARRAEGRP